MRPRIGWLLGDPNGVGPEISAKLLAQPAVTARADIVVLGAPAVWQAGQRVANVTVDARPLRGFGDPLAGDRVNFLALPLIEASDISVGRATRRAGEAVLASLDAAADALRAGHLDALVFAPLNKQAMRLAGLRVESELEHLAERLGHRGPGGELNVLDGLWTSRVTSHIALRDVADAITVEAICTGAYIIDRALRTSGKAAPRIAVCALNPHAGDGGTMGREEIEVIEPAIRRLRQEGIEASGPFPADTAFLVARREGFDAVLTMYHDQGQIAMKTMGFERGVTVLGGLPFPIATPAQGTAFDIAGRGVASPEALRRAFELAVEMASRGLRR